MGPLLLAFLILPSDTPAAPKERVVCRKVQVTGSHISKRVCRPWAEWKRMEQEAQNDWQRERRGPVRMKNN